MRYSEKWVFICNMYCHVQDQININPKIGETRFIKQFTIAHNSRQQNTHETNFEDQANK